MSNWKTKSLCELTLEDVLQGHAEGYSNFRNTKYNTNC